MCILLLILGCFLCFLVQESGLNSVEKRLQGEEKLISIKDSEVHSLSDGLL